MKIKFLISVLVGATAISLIYFNINSNCVLPDEKPAIKTGSGEEAAGRMEYEIMRLRDPETGLVPKGIRGAEMAFAKTLPKTESGKSLDWNALGPNNVGGRTRCFGVDVNNDNIIVAGSVSGGIWRSTDGGQSWVKVSGFQDNLSISCMKQDTRAGHTDTWYAGSGEAYGTSASASGAFFLGNGMYKSTDNGLTWNLLESTTSDSPQSYQVWDLEWNVALDPSIQDSDRILVALPYRGILKSDDGGESFQVVLAPGGVGSNATSYFADVVTTSTGVSYASLSSDGSKKGIWRSPNGVDWTKILPQNFPEEYNRLVIGIDPNNENIVYFLGETPGSGMITPANNTQPEEGNSLWKYTYYDSLGAGDNGQWVDLSAHLPHTGGSLQLFRSQGSYDLTLKVKPGDPNAIFIGGSNLYRSTDGFTTDDNITHIGGYGQNSTLPFYDYYPNHHPDQHNLYFLPSNPEILYSSCDGGFFRTDNSSDDNIVWSSLNNGYRSTQFYTVAIDPATPGSDMVFGGLQDNGSYWTNTADGSAPWVSPAFGDGAFCAMAGGSSTYYFSRQNGRITKKILDSNGNPTAYERIDPIGADGYLFVHPFALDPNENSIMYLPVGKKLWRNDDLDGIPLQNQYETEPTTSTNWFTFTDSISGSFSCVSVSTNPAHTVYLGTSAQKMYKVIDANTGDNPLVEITNAAVANDSYVNCIAVDPQDANKIMAVYSNYLVYSLFYSSDGGENWEKCAGNLEYNINGSGNGPSCRWAEIMHVGDEMAYFVGTSTGLYATDTLMGPNTVWQQLGANSIGNVVVDMLKTRESDGFIAVATHGNGVYTTHISEIGDILGLSAKNNLEAKLTLFPNPAENTVNLKFDLRQSSKVRIQIIDIQGKIVRSVDRGVLPEGTQQLSLDVSALENGSYVMRMNAGQLSVTKTFVVK